MFGGFNGKEVFNDLFRFTISDETWHIVPPTEISWPKARTGHAACLDNAHGGRFYLFGGSGKLIGQENMNDLWVFEHGSFREVLLGGPKTFRPPGMYGHSLSYVNNSLFVIGGTTGFDYFKDVYKFDIASHLWQKVQTSGYSLEPRYKHTATAMGDRIIVVGGVNQNLRLGNILEFNVEKRQWSELPFGKGKSLYKGRFGHATVAQLDSLLIFGGSEEEIKADLIQNNLNTGCFTRLQTQAEERDFHTCCLAGGFLYIIGVRFPSLYYTRVLGNQARGSAMSLRSLSITAVTLSETTWLNFFLISNKNTASQTSKLQ